MVILVHGMAQRFSTNAFPRPLHSLTVCLKNKQLSVHTYQGFAFLPHHILLLLGRNYTNMSRSRFNLHFCHLRSLCHQEISENGHNASLGVKPSPGKPSKRLLRQFISLYLCRRMWFTSISAMHIGLLRDRKIQEKERVLLNLLQKGDLNHKHRKNYQEASIVSTRPADKS